MNFIPRGGIGVIIFFSFWIIGAVLQWIFITSGRKVHEDKRYVFRMAGKVVSNLLAGVLIIVYRPFHRGDKIAVAGCEGKVQEIDLRYTIVKGENKIYLIPNSTLFTNTISILDKKQQ